MFPTEVRADLQRYYGINIERMGEELSVWQVAACVRCLPLGSATLSKVDPRAQYTMTEYLLHRIGDVTARQHLAYPWEKSTEAIADFGAVDRDEFDAWYASRQATEEVTI